MPYLRIQTNRSVHEATRPGLLARASRTVAEALGKPEHYVMVALETDAPMVFAGSDAPLAYLELKSIGLSDDQTADLSRVLSGLVQAELDIPQDRVYIEFADAPRRMWGWNGDTF